MKKSNIILIFNGLGNQMSQYAFYLATKERMPNTKYLCWDNDHNGYELDRLFGIAKKPDKMVRYIFRILMSRRKDILMRSLKCILKALKIGIRNEDFQYAFNLAFTLQSDYNLTIWFGGWHNFRYFDNIKNQFPQIFKFPVDKLNTFSTGILNGINTTNSVSIHVRRGDYLKGANRKMFGEICTLDYYRKAIDYVRDRVDNPTFFIFSNDIEWVNDNLDIPDAIFVDKNSGNDSWMDMYLMSKCQNIIIANSTFSWWGAYLSEASVVICPSRFINDEHSGEIYPDNWIRVS